MVENVMISVVTTVRDKKQFLKSARSIMDQKTSFDYEYIVVDCGSTEQNVKKELKSLLPGSNSLKQVRFLQYKIQRFNRGIANNVGFKWALGEWFLTFDCDLVVKPDYLEKLYEKALKLQSCMWCLGTESNSGKVRPWCGSGIMLVPMKIVYQIRGYDESFSGYGEEDIDFCHRIGRCGHRIIKVESPAWLHLSHSNEERGQAQRCGRLHGGANVNRGKRETNDFNGITAVNLKGDWGVARGTKIVHDEVKVNGYEI